MFGEGGWPEFEALQSRMHVSDASQARLLAGQNPVTYLVFDLLQLDGRPLLDLAYRYRRELLDELGLVGPNWQTPPSFPGEDFEAVRAVSAEHHMEGVVAKRLDSRYLSGARTDNWRKIKNHSAPGGRRGRLQAGQGQPHRPGRVAADRGGTDHSGLIYAGHVGTGFSAETLRMLGERLERNFVAHCSLPETPAPSNVAMLLSKSSAESIRFIASAAPVPSPSLRSRSRIGRA